jgi:hypothetical protein
MRLSDLFRDIDLGAMGSTALVLFFLVFVAVVVRTILARRDETDDRLSRLALDDHGKETEP